MSRNTPSPSYQQFLRFCTRMARNSIGVPEHVSIRVPEDAPQASTSNELGAPDSGTESDPGIQVTAELDEIRRLVECPVCLEIALPPITLCVNGHFVCNFCKATLRSCPTCRDRFSQVRNWFAEEFLEKCLLRCRYHLGNGCPVKLPGSALAAHVPVCEYRPLFCRDCDKTIPYHGFLTHLRDVEMMEICPAPNAECINGFQIDDETFAATKGLGYSIIWFQAHGRDFFCFLEIVHNSHWWIWVACFGTREESNKFKCSIVVWNEETKMKMKYAGKVHPYRTCCDEVLRSGFCLSSSDASFRNLLNEGGLDVVIKIINLEEQLTSDSEGATGEGESPLDVGRTESVKPRENESCLRINRVERKDAAGNTE